LVPPNGRTTVRCEPCAGRTGDHRRLRVLNDDQVACVGVVEKQAIYGRVEGGRLLLRDRVEVKVGHECPL
jgi:hypothetical protein